MQYNSMGLCMAILMHNIVIADKISTITSNIDGQIFHLLY
jgi:hypothetical protein